MTKRLAPRRRGRPRLSESDRTVMLAVHLPRSLKASVVRAAEKCYVSPSRFVRLMIMNYFREFPIARKGRRSKPRGGAR